jgi:hypothetical protein
LINFELSLTNPSTIYEQEKIELFDSKTRLASSMINDGLISSDWIYKNIFNFTDEEIKEQDEGIIYDFKQKFRRSQIESEGNDPAKTGETQGTPSDMAMGRTGHELDDKGGSPEGGFEGAGRPKEIPKYGKDDSARGRDPLGAVDKANATKSDRTLALSHFDKLKKSMKFGNETKILSESNELEDEYNSEVESLIDE